MIDAFVIRVKVILTSLVTILLALAVFVTQFADEIAAWGLPEDRVAPVLAFLAKAGTFIAAAIAGIRKLTPAPDVVHGVVMPNGVVLRQEIHQLIDPDAPGFVEVEDYRVRPHQE